MFQMIEVQTQVSQNTEALKGAQTEVSDLRRQIQTLEIELESQKSLVRSSVSIHSITPNAFISAPAKSALSLQVSHSNFVDTGSALQLLAVKTLTPSASSLTADRKPLWKGR